MPHKIRNRDTGMYSSRSRSRKHDVPRRLHSSGGHKHNVPRGLHCRGGHKHAAQHNRGGHKHAVSSSGHSVYSHQQTRVPRRRRTYAVPKPAFQGGNPADLHYAYNPYMMDWVKIEDWILQDESNCVVDISPYFCDVEAVGKYAPEGLLSGVLEGVTLRTSDIAVPTTYIHQEDNEWLTCKLVKILSGARLDAKATSKGPTLYQIGGLCGIESSLATPVSIATLKKLGQVVSLANFKTVQTVKRTTLIDASVKIDTSTRQGITGYKGLARMRDIYSPKLAAALLAYSEMHIAATLNKYHLYHGSFEFEHGMPINDEAAKIDDLFHAAVHKHSISYNLGEEIARYFTTYKDIDIALEQGFIEEGDVESESVTVYRGTKFASPEAFLASFKSGVQYSRGYMSTSPSIQVAAGFIKASCCVMKIEVPPGTPMLSLSIASYYREQDEVLLSHNTVLHIQHHQPIEHINGIPVFRVIAEYRGVPPSTSDKKSVCRYTTTCDIVRFTKFQRPIRGPKDVSLDAEHLFKAAKGLPTNKCFDLPEWYALRASADYAQAANMLAPTVSGSAMRPHAHDNPQDQARGWNVFRTVYGLPEFRPVQWVSPSPFDDSDKEHEEEEEEDDE